VAAAVAFSPLAESQAATFRAQKNVDYVVQVQAKRKKAAK
jgi:hypothetical protein